MDKVQAHQRKFLSTARPKRNAIDKGDAMQTVGSAVARSQCDLRIMLKNEILGGDFPTL